MKTYQHPVAANLAYHQSAMRVATLLFGLLVAGAGLPGHSAAAKEPAPRVTTMHGVVVTLEDNSLTVAMKKDLAKADQKLTLAADCAISLTPDQKNETCVGQRGDLVPGVGVDLTLGADGATVQAIQVMGRTLRGEIAAVDATSLTLRSKTKVGAMDEKFELLPTTAIVLSSGKDKGTRQTGSVADLKAGMPVAIVLSAVKKTTVRELTVQPEKANPKAKK